MRHMIHAATKIEYKTDEKKRLAIFKHETGVDTRSRNDGFSF